MYTCEVLTKAFLISPSSSLYMSALVSHTHACASLRREAAPFWLPGYYLRRLGISSLLGKMTPIAGGPL